uniref:Amidohydrolase-related domain-containing protein n=1 Tax=Panagrolaimus sp. JU765 TaxID=591449 RepID=A0AC34QV52_9BILA
MFPWLTFLTFPEPKGKTRKLKFYTTDLIKGDLVHTVQIFNQIPWIRASTQGSKLSIQSLQSSAPSTSSKSPRPCASPHSSGGSSSQPTSSRDKQPLFAPPPEPKPTRSQRKGLETSSAMLELFGGGGQSPFLDEKKEKISNKTKIVEPEAKISEIVFDKENEKTKSFQTEFENGKLQGASACFQEINHPEIQKNFGRKNILEKEMNEKTEWEEIKKQPSTSSTFQTIEDHDAKYAESLSRSKWESTSTHFNVIESTSSDDILAQPGPEKFDDEEQNCPAKELLENPNLNLRCNVQINDEVTISEEFIPDENERKKPIGTERNYESKDKQIELNNPGPEMEDDEEILSDKEELSVNGQKVTMDAMVEESMCCKEKAEESIAPAVPKAEPALARVFENTTAAIAVLSTLVAVSGRTNADNTTNKNFDHTKSSVSNKPGVGGNIGGTTGRGSQMVSLNSGNSGSASNGSGSGEKPIIVRGGQIVNDDSIVTADILIEDGIIKQVSSSLTAPENAEVIEAAGKLVLPAGIDAHTEFSTPGSIDDFAVGTKAALAGGTTTVIDVVIPRPEDTLLSAFERCRQQAQQRSVCNVGLSVIVPKWSDATRLEMEILVREKGVNSFILDLFSDSDLFAACEHAKELGAHVRILPENRDLALLLEKRVLKSGITGPEGYVQSRPAQLEADRIQHVSNVAQITNCPITVLSVTSSEATNAVHHARRDGALITAEVPIIAIIGPNSSQSNILPKIPLREGSNNMNDALELLSNGPLSMCVSDHCGPPPSTGTNFTRISKGVTGVEERLMVLWEKAVTNGKIDPMRFVAVTSSNPAKTFNLYPNKGRIGVGADADIVVWDIKSSRKLSSKNHLSKTDSSIFESINVRAQPIVTICNGKIVFKDGKHVGTIPGMGTFLELKPNSPFVFSVVHLRENMNSFNLNAGEMSSPPPLKQVDDRPLTGTTAKNRNIQTDQQQDKPRTKVIHPPGGKSSGFW